MKSIVFLAVLVVLLGCASQSGNTHAEDSAVTISDTGKGSISQAAGTDTAAGVLSGRWNLVPAMPSDTATGRLPFLNFDTTARRVNGNTGCNSFSGKYQGRAGSLSFSQDMITTKMACTGYDEAAFLKNLLRTNQYLIRGDTLQLQSDQTPLSYWVKSR